MGRPRTPTKVIEMRGAFRKNPNRKRTDPQVKGPIGNAPKHLSAKEKKIWDEVVENAPVGVLTSADRIALEEMCSLIYERRYDLASMPCSKRNLLRSYVGVFGMTPGDRSRVNVPGPKERNRFEGL